MIKEVKNPPHFQLILDNQTLAQVCQQARLQPVVALDTEFVRTRSYYPQLGLIQLYDGERLSLIDPLEISDFSPFVALLADINVCKVLHACYEDLEVFQHYFQQLPQPLLDTQIMAQFLGFAQSTGLATLIQHYFALEIDKGASRTDWLARPLSDKQLQYAAADVWYLLPLYQQMQQALAQTPWQSAVQFDCHLLLEKQAKPKCADSAYLAIPHAHKLAGAELMRLQLLTQWRQQEAMKRDLALNFVVRGEHLWQVAKFAPKHTSELLELGLSAHEVRLYGKKLLQLVERAQSVAEQDYPPPIKQLAEEPHYKRNLKALQNKLKQIAPADLAAEVISTRRGFDSLLKWFCWKNCDAEQLPDLMRDWRKPFGEALLQELNAQEK